MNMWKDIEVENVDGIDKLISEFTISMNAILPYGTMKIRVYKEQSGLFYGITNVQIKRIFDGDFEASLGNGDNEEEALKNTLLRFNEKVNDDYPDLDELGLKEDEIKYVDWSEF